MLIIVGLEWGSSVSANARLSLDFCPLIVYNFRAPEKNIHGPNWVCSSSEKGCHVHQVRDQRMFAAKSSQQGLVPAGASLLQGTFCQQTKPFWKRGTQVRSFELQSSNRK